jgi:hypothetical protein
VFTIRDAGRACPSGYPDGVDANPDHVADNVGKEYVVVVTVVVVVAVDGTGKPVDVNGSAAGAGIAVYDVV